MVRGMSLGPTMPCQSNVSYPDTVDSITVGKSGAAGLRCALVTATARSLSQRTCGIVEDMLLEDERSLARHRVDHPRPRALVRQMDHLGPGHIREKLGDEMHVCASSARSVVDRVGLRLGERDHVLDGFQRRCPVGS